MSFQDAWDALHLRMPSRIPRTEYSASGHWPLIQAVTGIPVRFDSAEPVKREAAMAFERAWDFGLTWNTLTYNEVFQGRCTRMGHAVYADGGVDYDTRQFCPFADENEVYFFMPKATQGLPLSISQNFLTGGGTIERLLATSDIDGNDLVLEIGAGKGHITKRLSPRCRRV